MTSKTVEDIIQNDKKICFKCGTTTTYIESGYERWYNYKEHKICSKCYQRIARDERKIYFKKKFIIIKGVSRKKKCEECGNNKGRIALHHIEYDDNNPLKHTKELCGSCHAKETWRQIKNGEIKRRKRRWFRKPL